MLVTESGLSRRHGGTEARRDGIRPLAAAGLDLFSVTLPERQETEKRREEKLPSELDPTTVSLLLRASVPP
jgi:hypothetical protein